MSDPKDDDFGFEKESSPLDSTEGGPFFFGQESEETSGGGFEDEPPPRKRSILRLLLIVLLLAAVAAGLYFYFVPLEEPPVARVPVSQTEKRPIPRPATPAPARPQTPAVPSPPPAITPPALPQAQIGPEKPAAAEKMAEPAPAAPLATEAPAANPPAAAAPAQPQAKPAQTGAGKPAATPPSAAPAAAAKAAPDAYRVLAGAFLGHSSLAAAEKKLRSLGYSFQTKRVKHSVTMTRLKYGSFPEAEARSKLDLLQQTVPDAFLVHEGDVLTLYLGSFRRREDAVTSAQQLRAKGLASEPVDAEVEMTLQQLSFGPFPDLAAAEAAIARAGKAGLEDLTAVQQPVRQAQ
jgi:SPOR domain